MAQTVGHIDEFTSEQGTGLYSNLPGANGSIIIHAGRKVLRYGQYSILQCSYLIQVIEPSTKCYFLPLELQPFCAELLGKQKVCLFFYYYYYLRVLFTNSLFFAASRSACSKELSYNLSLRKH